MKTPIVDFVKKYAQSGVARFHMPGHKGVSFLGCETLDITEIKGADVLYSAEGIISQSEENASRLFGSFHTFYSTEGSSLCIKAMLALACNGRERPVVLAARNAHKSFVNACALLDVDVRWLYGSSEHLCSSAVTPSEVEGAIDDQTVAVYLTSPDYLGNVCDVKAIADVCHAHGVPLLVDNAHGAYLKFLPESMHPLTLGADMCCDSAHKTLPVLTGGAYLHVAREEYAKGARNAFSIFASTSPSYLVLQSLDMCNDYIDNGYAERLSSFIIEVEKLKKEIGALGFFAEDTEPLKIVINANRSGYTGEELSELLRHGGIEAEFADGEYVVFMVTPETSAVELELLKTVLSDIPQKAPIACDTYICPRPSEPAMTIRQATFAKREIVPTQSAQGRVSAAPTVSCPPAVPIVVSGEQITAEQVSALLAYGVTEVEVVVE